MYAQYRSSFLTFFQTSLCLVGLALAGVSSAQTNLALNKTCTANSWNQSNAAYGLQKAVDGDTSTRWDVGTPVIDCDTTWLCVDLGTRTDGINLVTIKFEYAFPRRYNIMVSNDQTTWTLAYHVDWSTCFQNKHLGIDSIYFTPVSARYVKMQTLQRATPYGISIKEIGIYANVTPPSNPETFVDPGPNAPFCLSAPLNPCEYIAVGAVKYSTWKWSNTTAYFTINGVLGWDSLSFPGGTTNQWTYKWKEGTNGTPVNGMAGIWYGTGEGTTSPGTILPLPVTDNILTTWQCTYTGTGAYDVAYDMWTNTDGSTANADEVMIMLHTNGNYILTGTTFGQVTLAGIKWNVYGTVGALTKTFQPADSNTVGIHNFSADLKDFFSYLKTNNLLSGTYLHGMWCGDEVQGNNTGTVTTTNWTISSPQVSINGNSEMPKSSTVHSAAKTIKMVVNPNGTISPAGTSSQKAYSLRGEMLNGPATNKAGATLTRTATDK